MRVGLAMGIPSARRRPSWGIQANFASSLGTGEVERRPLAAALPTIVGERLVRFGHLVHIVLALDRSAHAVGGVEEFVGQALRHGLFPTLPRVTHQPPDGEGGGPARTDLDRDLV